MTDQISLTAAELAFLLSVGDTAGDSPAAGLFGFTPDDRTDMMLGAGLGSLLLRHLAVPADDQQIQLGPVVAAIAQGIGRPEVCVQVGMSAEGGTDGVVLFEAGQVRFVVARRAYRCFDIAALDAATDRHEALVELAREFVERHGGGSAAFSTVRRDRWEDHGTVTLSKEGQWAFAPAGDPLAAVYGPTAEDAFDRLRASLTAVAVS
jgi:hypothetical protein